MGAIVTIQTAFQLSDDPLIPTITCGNEESITLNLVNCSSLILAGKVGSNIASSLGTMRVSEQIDALEVMGVNSLAISFFRR